MIKYLVLALSALSASEQDKVIRTLKEAIRFEISTIIFKLLIGIVLTSTIIFSLFQFGLNVKILLDKFQNGLAVQMFSFASIALIGFILLYYLFRRNQANILTKNSPQEDQMDFRSMGIKFIEGMIEGYGTHVQTENITSDDIYSNTDKQEMQ